MSRPVTSVISILKYGFLLLLPLLTLWLPLPFAPSIAASNEAKFTLCLIFLGVAIFLILIRNLVVSRLSKLVWVSSAWLALPVAIIFGALFRPKPPLETFYILGFVPLLLLLASFALLGKRRDAPKGVPGEGLLTLLLTLGCIWGLERSTRSIPEPYLLKEITKVPALLPPVDKGNAVLLKNGFRGQLPCADCGEKLFRVVTMGGSSTYGIPMYYTSSPYASVLQRLLEQRRPDDEFEILNGGIPGFGITQVNDALNSMILKYKPDMVTACVFFNDSGMAPGWYGIPGVSDREALDIVTRLRSIQEFPLYLKLTRSRLFSIFRFYVVALREKITGRKELYESKKRRRSEPSEFADGLREFIKLGEAHNFLPVLVFEPMNRTQNLETSLKTNKYYQAMHAVAEETGVPLVNSLDKFSSYPDSWLFYDVIHTNEAGHKLMAEAIYESIFTSANKNPRAREFLKSKGIDPDAPKLERSALLQFDAEKVKGKVIRFKARAPHQASLQLGMTASSPTSSPFALGDLTETWSDYKIAVDQLKDESPILDLQVRAQVQELPQKDEIGKTGVYAPTWLKVESAGELFGWHSSFEVGHKNIKPRSQGYSLVTVDGKSGKVLSFLNFDPATNSEASANLAKALADIANQDTDGIKPIVMISVSKDGNELADQRVLSSAFKSIGGSGNIPAKGQSFILIGIPGSAPGTAFEEVGDKLLVKQLGHPALRKAELIEVSDVSIGE